MIEWYALKKVNFLTLNKYDLKYLIAFFPKHIQRDRQLEIKRKFTKYQFTVIDDIFQTLPDK